MNPELLSSRTPGMQIVVADVVPAVFGLIVGIIAGVSEPIYLILSVLAIAGGYIAGMEHRYPSEGALRGAAGGLLYGSFILVGHAVSGLEEKADIPPGVVLVLITTLFGAGLGALGARSRGKRMRDQRESATVPS
jgi:hypothetical protein